MKYKILDTVATPSPQREAETLSACLAADRGVGSQVLRIDSHTWDVAADDGRAIRFTSMGA